MHRRTLIFNKDTYTADTSLKLLSGGRYIHDLTFALKGQATSDAILEAEDLLGLLNRIDVLLDGSPIVQLRGFDLLALNALLGLATPHMLDSTAATSDHAIVTGLKLPLAQPARELGKIALKCDWATVTGCDTTTLTVAETSMDNAIENAYYHMVEIPMTLAGATGFGNTIALPQPGALVGILFYNNDPPQAGDTDTSISEIRLKVDGRTEIEATWQDIKQFFPLAIADAQVAGVNMQDCYAFLDLRDDPIPRDSSVLLDVNAGVASQAIRIIPVYRCA